MMSSKTALDDPREICNIVYLNALFAKSRDKVHLHCKDNSEHDQELVQWCNQNKKPTHCGGKGQFDYKIAQK